MGRPVLRPPHHGGLAPTRPEPRGSALKSACAPPLKPQNFQRRMDMRRILALMLAAVTLSLSGCGYNDMQRRAELVPNLVNTVKGFAAQEQQVFIQVTEARAKVGSIQATPELINDPAAFAKFQQAQAGLSSALSRLLVVSENYPQLKSDANFRDLQA